MNLRLNFFVSFFLSIERNSKHHVINNCSDLVHSEADGLQVQAFLPQLPSVLLHQCDHHAAHVVFVVSVLQLQLVLRVGPESV